MADASAELRRRQLADLMAGTPSPYRAPWEYPEWTARNGEMRNALAPPRPNDVMAPVAEAISPTMGGYGLGQGLGHAFEYGRNREYGNALGEIGMLAAGAIMPGPKGAPRQRKVSPLGFYSALDETLAGFGPKDRVTAATLQQRGVKAAEIEARGLAPLLKAGPVPVSDLMAAARANPVEVRERVTARDGLFRTSDHGHGTEMWGDDTKWSAHSLDPSNPSYRETVLHLPGNKSRQWTVVEHPTKDGNYALQDAQGGYYLFEDKPASWPSRESAERGTSNDTNNLGQDFISGHFPEPNIIGHMQTSLNKHEGRPVYTIDQIQSDWGQKLRDGGVRDEAKIAELRNKVDKLNAEFQAIPLSDRFVQPPTGQEYLGQSFAPMAENIKRALALADAELRTAEATTPGHPLVNSTDQWTNTTLRRALTQAVDADAHGIAIPSGDTVLSYNPGDKHGMNAFYNDIVPKNLGNMLAKMDPGIQRRYLDTLETPGKGHAGQGFSYFELSPQAREAIRRGLPLFSLPAGVSMANALAPQDQDRYHDR